MSRLIEIITAGLLILGLGIFHHCSTIPGPFHGDEIHYLVMTISLLNDGDLNLLNNYSSSEVTSMTAGRVTPHYSYNRDGRAYSAHEPALSALLMLPYHLGDKQGIVWFLTLLSVLAVMQVFYMAKQLQVSSWTACVMTLVVGSSLPFCMMSGKMFPEMAGALLLALGFRWMMLDTRLSRHLMGCMSLAMLPWFHLKFGIFSGLVFLAYLVQQRPRLKNLVVVTIPAVISLSLLAYLQYTLFQNPWYMFQIKAGGFGNPWPGMAGLMFDRETGLLVFAPVLVLGILSVFRFHSRFPLVVMALVVLIYWTISGSWIDWHSGHCPPARYLIPLLPFLGTAMAFEFNKPGSKLRWIVLAFLWLLSVLQVIGVVLTIPESAIVQTDGLNRLWNYFLPEIFALSIPSWLTSGPGLIWSFFGLIAWVAMIAVLIFFRQMKLSFRILCAAGFLSCAVALLGFGGSREMAQKTQLRLTPLAQTAPDLISPAHDSVWWGRFPDLEWNSVAGADGFVYVIEFPDGEILRVPKYGSTRVSFADGIIELVPAGRYCWRVIPVKNGVSGIPSRKNCFQLFR